MVGSALVRALTATGSSVITASRKDVDLTDQAAVRSWMKDHRPEAIFLAAARVGGILANDSFPADFLYENLMIEANVISAARDVAVEKLLFLGSSCIYPKLAPQPISEDALLTGPLEPTNEWYAVAKIAGIKLCQAFRRQYGCDFISVMPTNLYGPGDNYDPMTSHVLPALIRKFHSAKASGETVTLWGSGKPRREFLHVDDCAAACVHLMQHYSDEAPVNVGSGADMTILELGRLVQDVVGHRGAIEVDPTKPDGTMRKLMDSSRLRATGWEPKIPLREGIAMAYRDFLVRSA